MAVRLPRLRTASLRAGTAWYRVYNATWGYDEHNPGYGDARFSPYRRSGRWRPPAEHVPGRHTGRGVAGDGLS